MEFGYIEFLCELFVFLWCYDLLWCVDDFEVGVVVGVVFGEEDLCVVFNVICDNVGKDWRRLVC